MLSVKENLRSTLPWSLLYAYRKLRALPEDLPHILHFLFNKTKVPTTVKQRLRLVARCYQISYLVDSPHMENELIRVMEAILNIDPQVSGVIVEAGSYKGSSGAKISLAANISRRKLYLFDSFEGLPKHDEVHTKNIFGGDAYFPPASYKGSLKEVKEVIALYGDLNSCNFIQGWFEDTMPRFEEKIAVAYIDVDLESSTETCLTYLYPLLIKNGELFSQDGHLPWVTKLLDDDSFWNKLNTNKPEIEGLRKEKLVKIIKG